MWYVAGDSWLGIDGKSVPTYEIRHLASAELTTWGRNGEIVLKLAAGGDEYGFGRPFVLRDGGRYKMWYSIRTVSKGYRLGYAESNDGLVWTRLDDQVGIDISPSGWDSEMICYSCIQPTEHGTYLFYNGNNYGETGFGAARLVD